MTSASSGDALKSRFEEAKEQGQQFGTEAVKAMQARFKGEADCVAVFTTMIIGATLGAAMGELGADDALLILTAIGDAAREVHAVHDIKATNPTKQ
jgi:hypothetical protein